MCDSDNDMPELTRTPEQTFDATKTQHKSISRHFDVYHDYHALSENKLQLNPNPKL